MLFSWDEVDVINSTLFTASVPMRWWLCKVTEHWGWNGKDTLFSFLLQSLWH